MASPTPDPKAYWNAISGQYQDQTRIRTDDFHYGPLLPGDKRLRLLPKQLSGLRCLEVGCGAGQNSLYLASRGAICEAIDISEAQLEVGRALASQLKLDVAYRQLDMDELNETERFDLVHSVYALPFSANPRQLVGNMLKALRPGGTLLLSTGHPLYGNEWMSFDDGEEGLFVEDYYQPLQDLRLINGGDVHCTSDVYPISTIVDWITEQGAALVHLKEPRALESDELPDEAPYFSEEWANQADLLRKIPIVLVVAAEKKETFS